MYHVGLGLGLVILTWFFVLSLFPSGFITTRLQLPVVTIALQLWYVSLIPPAYHSPNYGRKF